MKKLIILLTVSLLLCSCSNRVVTPRVSDEDRISEKNIVSFVKVSDRIVMDKYTGVLYVREENATYSGLKVYTTFPLMKADGTCLTYQDVQNRGKVNE